MTARSLILTLTAAALIAVPYAASAQSGPGDCDGTGPHGPHMKGGPGGPGGPGAFDGPGLLHVIQRAAERIGLTDAQQTQIQAIVDVEMPAARDLMDQARAAAETFRANHDPGDFNEAEYRAFFESQARIHTEARLIGARTADQVWDVLTPDQQQQILDLMALMGPGQGGGPRGGGGKRLGRR